MTALQVRDFPEELYGELREVAKREHRSIAQQTIIAVQAYLSDARESNVSQKHLDRRRAVFEQIQTLPCFEVPRDFPTPEQIVRELRDAR